MPSTLPVPSKGALRTLRQLALGTSCTIAFGTGVITEDRRRRIEGAREIHDNAQRLKASGKYYSAGRALLDTLDDHVMGGAFWLAGDPKLRRLNRETNESLSMRKGDYSQYPQSVEETEALPEPKIQPQQKTIGSNSTTTIPKAHAKGLRNNLNSIKDIPTVIIHFPVTLPPPLPSLDLDKPRQVIRSHQLELAAHCTKLFKSGRQSGDVAAAISRFLDAFGANGPLSIKDGLSPQLLDIAVKLSSACMKFSMYGQAEQLLNLFLKQPSPKEKDFFLFSPYQIIETLIDGVSSKRFSPYRSINTLIDDASFKSADMVRNSRANLEKAAFFYLQTFNRKRPTPPDTNVKALGERLFLETFRFAMYDHCRDIYLTFRHYWGGGPPIAITHLIEALFTSGQRKMLFSFFKEVYCQTSPDPHELSFITLKVMEFNLELGKLDRAEETLFISNKIAEAGGFQVSTTPILKLIGHYTKSRNNLSKAQELFDRLEPVISRSHHPQAVYGAIIQACVEAGQPNGALDYYARLMKKHESLSGDVRIFGHFVQARAMQKDWEFVKEGLRNMSRWASAKQKACNNSFTHILKLFAKSHPINETEDLVRTCIDQYGFQLTPFVMTVMVNAYLTSRELEALVRWLDYATSVGCPIQAGTVNGILSGLHRSLKFTFPEIFGMYRAICDLESKSGGPLTDKFTLEILGKIAIADSPDAAEVGRRLRLLKGLGRSKHSWDTEGIYRAMTTTFAKGDHAATLRIYQSAVDDKNVLKTKHLVSAVRASLLAPESSMDEAARLIKAGQVQGLEVGRAVGPLIIHQLEQMSVDEEFNRYKVAAEVSRRTLNTLRTLEKHEIIIIPHILTHTMSILQKRGWASQAIELWKTVHRTIPSACSMDLESLSVLLRCYIQLQDPEGLRWTQKVLTHGNLIPDKRFYLQLKFARKEYYEKLKTGPNAQSEYISTLTNLLNSVGSRRGEIKAEKDNVKEMTVKIMENAILKQGSREARKQHANIKARGVESTCNSEVPQEGESDVESFGSSGESDTDSLNDFNIKSNTINWSPTMK
ncbi:hypothetical protein BGZ60DRAFT_409492 [Tricladium varicosporioides]|nr:hypothetical protein BGZ60DRAFT_409492 [Hymenoscyphus varicosporioides]